MKPYIDQHFTPLTRFRHLLVGDLSGIQEFIFNMQSEGAAKTLKARSYYVQAVSEIVLEIIDEALSRECLLFYNGGGNFYVFCQDISPTALKVLREDLQRHLADHELYLSLSAVPLDINDFGGTWRLLHQASSRDKLKKFSQYWEAFDLKNRFDRSITPKVWKQFTTRFVNQTSTRGFEIEEDHTAHQVTQDGFRLGGYRLLRSTSDARFEGSIVNKLPLWDISLMEMHKKLVDNANARKFRDREEDEDESVVRSGHIIEFETFGELALQRSGTDKIAVLKMDADNLGKKFLTIHSPDEAKKLSDLFKTFFDKTMLDLWQSSFSYFDREGQSKQEPFCHNIYPVFSGGDDCMFIGGWDAVFEFTKVVHERFTKDVTTSDSTLTLSGALTMFDSKYPVVRLAQLSEDALKSAKAGGRNRISVFGTTLTWDDFGTAHRIAKDLEKLIKQEEEPRGILERIKLSHRGFAKLQDWALDGNINNPALWRLFYFIRKGKNFAALEEIIQQYEQALLFAVIKNKPTNPAAFPIAARWAEFLTR